MAGGGLPTSESDIYGVQLSPTGEMANPNGIPICRTPGLQRSAPAVGANGSGYFVAWEDYRNFNGGAQYDVYGARITSAGIVLDTNGIPIATGPLQYFLALGSPAVGASQNDFLIVWENQKAAFSGPININGTLVSSAGAVAHPDGI